MTFQALALFLISWVVPAEASRDGTDGLPRWERHPAEQRHLREQDRRAHDLWSQFPRPW